MAWMRRRIADLEADRAEIQGFNERNRGDLHQHQQILDYILDEHQPLRFRSREGIRIELRCGRCQTDEHHTWGPDNHVPWPCPTIAPFLAYAHYMPAQADDAAAQGSES